MSKKLSVLAAAFVVATGLFWSTMVIAPPVTMAASPNPGLNVTELTTNTPKDLPSFDDKYQRHLGVLDVLKR